MAPVTAFVTFSGARLGGGGWGAAQATAWGVMGLQGPAGANVRMLQRYALAHHQGHTSAMPLHRCSGNPLPGRRAHRLLTPTNLPHPQSPNPPSHPTHTHDSFAPLAVYTSLGGVLTVSSVFYSLALLNLPRLYMVYFFTLVGGGWGLRLGVSGLSAWVHGPPLRVSVFGARGPRTPTGIQTNHHTPSSSTLVPFPPSPHVLDTHRASSI